MNIEQKDWSIPDANNRIDVPDHLMPLFNQIGMQIKFLTISGKNEVLTIAHIIQRAEKFFTEQYQSNPSELGLVKKEFMDEQLRLACKEGEEIAEKWYNLKHHADQLAEALRITYEALKDIIRQLPNDESLADYRLDFAEAAEVKAKTALTNYESLNKVK